MFVRCRRFNIRRAVRTAAALLLAATVANWPPAARADEKIIYLHATPA